MSNAIIHFIAWHCYDGFQHHNVCLILHCKMSEWFSPRKDFLNDETEVRIRYFPTSWNIEDFCLYTWI